MRQLRMDLRTALPEQSLGGCDIPPWEDHGSFGGASHPKPIQKLRKRMDRFSGNLNELKDLIALSGVDGEWEPKPNGCHKFRARNRAGLNWSETKHTVWFDGPIPQQAELKAAVIAAQGFSPPSPAKTANQDKTIFVVHGHDHIAKEQLELTLHRLGLSPYVLQDSGGAGKTIVEALEGMIGKIPASTFGIVLLTPDDVGHAKRDPETEAKPRARQNVILEMGMLLASLTRAKVAILQKGFVERPSDLDGVLYIPFNEHVREAVPKLAQRLQEAGIELDASAIARASS